jgi:hypothetical protein
MTTQHSIRRTVMATAIVGAVGLVVACSHHHAPASYGGGPNAVQASIDSAVERIAHEKCAREARCGNVGVNQTYADRDKCLSVERGRETEALSLESCPGGIDEHNLGECLSQIRGQECGASMSSITRRTDCRNRELCYH